MRLLAVVVSTSVTNRIQCDGQPRGQHRHRDDRDPAPVDHLGGLLQHLDVGEPVGAADLVDLAVGLLDADDAGEVADHVVDGRSAGSGSSAHFGTTMAGRFLTSCRVISQEMPPAPTTIAARSTVTGTPLAPSSFSTSRRERRWADRSLAVLAEPAEVDDLPDPAGRGREREGAGRLGVLALEVVVVEGVHQVDRDVDAVQRLGRACPGRRRRRRPGRPVRRSRRGGGSSP